jgi:hypothetical protein
LQISRYCKIYIGALEIGIWHITYVLMLAIVVVVVAFVSAQPIDFGSKQGAAAQISDAPMTLLPISPAPPGISYEWDAPMTLLPISPAPPGISYEWDAPELNTGLGLGVGAQLGKHLAVDVFSTGFVFENQTNLLGHPKVQPNPRGWDGTGISFDTAKQCPLFLRPVYEFGG